MKKTIIVLTACILGMSLMTSCSRKITRVATDAPIDISGRWNDTPIKYLRKVGLPILFKKMVKSQ